MLIPQIPYDLTHLTAKVEGRQVVDVPIDDVIEHYQAVDPDDTLVHTARGLGISFGDAPGQV